MATTLSSDPAACGLARFRNDAIRTTTSTAATAIRTILTGGRFFFAVPNSSPIRIVGPAGTAGVVIGFGGGAGGGSAIGFRPCRFYAPRARWGNSTLGAKTLV